MYHLVKQFIFLNGMHRLFCLIVSSVAHDNSSVIFEAFTVNKCVKIFFGDQSYQC